MGSSKVLGWYGGGEQEPFPQGPSGGGGGRMTAAADAAAAAAAASLYQIASSVLFSVYVMLCYVMFCYKSYWYWLFTLL